MCGKARFCLLLLTSVAIASGCAVARRPEAGHIVSYRNTIFNPSWTSLPAVDVSREDWPVAADFQPLGEQIRYRSTISDWQGRGDGRNDYYYRRFDSVRTGRGYR